MKAGILSNELLLIISIKEKTMAETFNVVVEIPRGSKNKYEVEIGRAHV